MNDLTLFILFVALVLDWRFGEPEFLWSRIPHPVVLFGKAVSLTDKYLNRERDSDAIKYRMGALAVLILLAGALLAAFFLQYLLAQLGWLGLLIETFIVFVLLAQKSLHDHVKAVADGLRDNGIDGGRRAVGMIVGRDASLLDRSGVCRASVESLAENFSDGVVAPAFWYAVFGLPGLIVYKMINTSDSMIAYRSEKYLWFGRVAAQIDDLANWLPARFSAFIIAGGVFLLLGVGAAKAAVTSAFQHSGLHRSPNAGWPEAAMAGGAGLAFGGPRVYAHESVQQAWINAEGKRQLDVTDIELCLTIFSRSCYVLWAFVVILLLL